MLTRALSRPVPAGFQPANDDDFQIFDLLQLTRREQAIRQECRRLIKALADWKRMSRSSHGALLPYVHLEGLLLRRRARESVMLYRMVRQDRIRAFRAYIESLPRHASKV